MTTSFSESPRILILAHSCNPEIGSEPGLGWNWTLQAAKHFPTWVLCDEAYNRAAIERYIARVGPIANLKFLFVPPSRTEDRIRRIPGGFYPAYNSWHRRALKIAHEWHDRIHFNLLHQLNWNGFREPGYLWQLDSPFMWGPIGGAQNYPWRFLTSACWKNALSESIRNVLNICQLRTSRRVGLAARKAQVMLAATPVNARAMQTRRQAPVKVLLETGVHPLAAPPERNFHHDGPLRILWSGVFEHRKALHVLLHALAALPKHARFELEILGRGPLENRWRRIAQQLDVDQHCRWLGWLDHDAAIDRFLWADVFAFSSLRDTSGTVMLESLAAGTPIVCFDHQGAGEIVTADCGIKIPVTNFSDGVQRWSAALLRLHDNRNLLERLSRGALDRAKHYAWDLQGERMATIYREVLGLPQTVTNDAPPEISPDDDRLVEAVAAGSVQGGM